MTAPATVVVVSPSESIVARCNTACAAVAAALNRIQTARYPPANIQARETGLPSRPRAIFAYIKIIGAALGSIIATIITAHIMKTSQRLTTLTGIGAAIRAPIAPKSDADMGILTRYNHESAVSAVNSARIRRRSRCGCAG